MCQDLEGFVDLIGDFYKVRIDLFKKLVSAVFSANVNVVSLSHQCKRSSATNPNA
jgi:3-methyladenine DNA glycosylase/8-oxoguanine DNA glycosylase